MDSHAISPARLYETHAHGATPMVRAVLDIGSNSVLLLVARVHPSTGQMEILRDESVVTRLSEGVAESGKLKSAAIDRTLVALHDFRTLAQSLGAIPVAVATAGVRMAKNPQDFLLPAAEILGSQVQMISGKREAELSYASVAMDCSAKEPLRVIDIGGGSTELVVGEGSKVVNACSHPIGSVRLTERFVHSDPIHPDELEAMERAIHESLSKQPLAPTPVLYGLAGTVTSAAALVLGLSQYDREKVDCTELSWDQLVRLRDELAAMSKEQRRELSVLGKGRSDVIVAGVTVLCAAMRHCGAETLRVRDRGLRYALLTQEPAAQ